MKLSVWLVAGALALPVAANAGNRDRRGQAGAQELMVNPWARTNGLMGMNTSLVQGVEAMKSNIGGLAYVDGTELGVSYSLFLRGSNVNVSNLALAQKLGDVGVLGVNIQSMGFGEIDITDVNHPEGGLGTFKPQFFNLQLGFAKTFSRSIHAGIAATFVSEQISNIKASGAAFEAGIQYQTGARDNFHFGVTLRNVGTNMSFSGEGFAVDVQAPESELYQQTRSIPSASFQMPTYLNFGAAYDFYLDENHLKSATDQPKHRLTAMAGFTSNSFTNDYIGAGLEYSFRDIFMVRGSYRYEKDITDATNSGTFYTGIGAGASVRTTIGKNGPALAIDYGYTPTVRPANGVHTFSLRFSAFSKKAKADKSGDTE